MTFSLYGTTFVDGTTIVPSAFLNKIRTEVPSAVDGRGGDYTNTSRLRFTTSGAAFEIQGDDDFTVSTTGGSTFSTGVTASALVLSGATFPTFSGRTFQRWAYPKLLSEGTLAVGGIVGTDISGKVALAVPTQTVTGYFHLEIPDFGAPQGASLINLYVLTLGFSGQGAGSLTLPTYLAQRVALGSPGTGAVGALSSLSSTVADAHTTGPGNWETDFIETTIPMTSGSHTFAPQSGTYQLKVTAPFNAADNAGLYIAAIGAQFTCTELRF